MKVAVVTPYYKERPEILRRCVESVREQTHGDVLHYLVADGHPQPETLRGYPGLRCIDLPVAHGDYGDTPRAVGATCALAEGADVLCLLDADNLYEPDHIESLLAVYRDGLQKGEPLDAVFAYRHLFLPGHEHLRLPDREDLAHRHVDTSCFSFARSAAALWPAWGLIPRGFAPLCDRVMLALVRSRGLRSAWTGRHTVLYESNWRAHYLQAGLPVPESGLHDASLASIDFAAHEPELFRSLGLRLRRG